MSKRIRMRQDEAGLKITEDFVLSHNGAGEILNEYRRLKTPLQLWLRNGLRQTEYEAGQRYGALWREVCQPKSPPFSDPTRIIVDGGSASPEGPDYLYRRGAAENLSDVQRAVADEETITFLNRLCGMEDWPLGDKRRFKRKCRKGLEVLAVFWRRR
jgi:hypothetical protein